MKTIDNYDNKCPRCGTYLDLDWLVIGLGEYGEYLDEKCECPHCHAELVVTTEEETRIRYEEA